MGSTTPTKPTQIRTILILLAGLIAIVIYYTFSPEGSWWFPKCPVKLLTGLDCPGCGGQRALHAALHGHFVQALHYNLFYIVGIPFLMIALAGALIKGPVGQWINRHLLTPAAGWVFVALYFIWFAVRNIWNL